MLVRAYPDYHIRTRFKATTPPLSMSFSKLKTMPYVETFSNVTLHKVFLICYQYNQKVTLTATVGNKLLIAIKNIKIAIYAKPMIYKLFFILARGVQYIEQHNNNKE